MFAQAYRKQRVLEFSVFSKRYDVKEKHFS